MLIIGGSAPDCSAETFDLAAELGPDGITVNMVAPGYVAGTEFFGDAMTGERHRNSAGKDPGPTASMLHRCRSSGINAPSMPFPAGTLPRIQAHGRG
jgi:NAD(P)-dependent dehydrogenase (short-subunit alcohol dehydrogenase family)